MNQSKEIMLKLSEFVKDMVKDALQSLMKEERLIYLEEYPTKANGFYTSLFGNKVWYYRGAFCPSSKRR